MHVVRNNSKTDDSHDIVASAMSMFSDLRSSVCVEGALLLLTCLPTIFIDYDKYLPTWLTIWTSIEHNYCWDVCWLSLFTRARKFSTQFDWSQIIGMLAVKARQFFGMNGNKG